MKLCISAELFLNTTRQAGSSDSVALSLSKCRERAIYFNERFRITTISRLSLDTGSQAAFKHITKQPDRLQRRTEFIEVSRTSDKY